MGNEVKLLFSTQRFSGEHDLVFRSRITVPEGLKYKYICGFSKLAVTPSERSKLALQVSCRLEWKIRGSCNCRLNSLVPQSRQ